jgi:hypothetical protein
METISNILSSLNNKSNDIWAVEWHIAIDGKKAINITTLDKHFKHSINCFKTGKQPEYQLLALADSIEQANEFAAVLQQQTP